MNTRPIHSSPQKSPLQTRFNLRAFLAGRAMLPDAYPTLDVSLEWPLPYKLSSTENVLAAGSGDSVALARPIAGNQAIVLRATIELATPGAGDQFSVVMRQDSLNNTAQDLTLNVIDSPTANHIPLIGTAVQYAPAAQLIGVRPVYVPPGFSCVALVTSAAGSFYRLNSLVVEYPETQPLSSLLAGF